MKSIFIKNIETENLILLKGTWNKYQNCYISMSNEFSKIESMDLKSISPALFQFSESEIEIPGIYQNIGSEAINSVIKISSFSRKLIVLKSKRFKSCLSNSPHPLKSLVSIVYVFL